MEARGTLTPSAWVFSYLLLLLILKWSILLSCDVMQEIRKSDHSMVERGQGNSVSVEVSILTSF